MKFNLLESEVKKIIELTYLGLYVLTNVKADKNWTEYESLSRKFIKYYIKNTKKMKMKHRSKCLFEKSKPYILTTKFILYHLKLCK